jgi:hypothetical protein
MPVPKIYMWWWIDMYRGAGYGQPRSSERDAEEAGVEEYRNELLDGWVGKEVLVKQQDAPDFDEEFAENLREDPLSSLTRPLAARTVVMVLESYDRIGITLRPLAENPIPLFVPWGAMIELSGMGPVE